MCPSAQTDVHSINWGFFSKIRRKGYIFLIKLDIWILNKFKLFILLKNVCHSSDYFFHFERNSKCTPALSEAYAWSAMWTGPSGAFWWSRSQGILKSSQQEDTLHGQKWKDVSVLGLRWAATYRHLEDTNLLTQERPDCWSSTPRAFRHQSDRAGFSEHIFCLTYL